MKKHQKLLKSYPWFRQFLYKKIFNKAFPEKEAEFSEPLNGLSAKTIEILSGAGINSLYRHQAEAYDVFKNGSNVLLESGSYSGKTTACFPPMCDILSANDSGSILLIYPSSTSTDKGYKEAAGFFSGFNPSPSGIILNSEMSGKIRKRPVDSTGYITTSPYVLHSLMLPEHPGFAGFFSNLQIIIIENIHSYSGIYGSHFSLVVKRLRRICKKYRSKPKFILTSSNPGDSSETAEKLIHNKVVRIQNNYSPEYEKEFYILNTSAKDPNEKSLTENIIPVFFNLIYHGYKTILFSDPNNSEVLYKRFLDTAEQKAPYLVNSVNIYRAGYMPEKRSKLISNYSNGKIKGVIWGNSFDLDSGMEDFDVALIAGYPTSGISFQLMSGHSGKRKNGTVILFTLNRPLDNYISHYPEFLFETCKQNLNINPGNPYILADQLLSAAYEIPVPAAGLDDFSPYSHNIMELLKEESKVRFKNNVYYPAGKINPSRDISLLSLNRKKISVIDKTSNTVIETVNETSAHIDFFSGAVFNFSGSSYLVDKQELDKNRIFVQKTDCDYFTIPRIRTKAAKISRIEETVLLPGAGILFGEITIHTGTDIFSKFHNRTGELIETVETEFKPFILKTTSFWIKLNEEHEYLFYNWGLPPFISYRAAGHLLKIAAALFSSSGFGEVKYCFGDRILLPEYTDTLFLFDNIKGGLGLAENLFTDIKYILKKCREHVLNCGCKTGCPSCVGYYESSDAFSDNFPAPSVLSGKDSVLILLNFILGLPEHKPASGSKRSIESKRTITSEKIKTPDIKSLPEITSKNLKNKLKKRLL